MYIWLFSRSVGAGSATTRNTRGLTRSVIALIVPPLPAPSRPSKRMPTPPPAPTAPPEEAEAARARPLRPLLQLDELDVELAQLLLVLLAPEPFAVLLRVAVPAGRLRPRAPRRGCGRPHARLLLDGEGSV